MTGCTDPDFILLHPVGERATSTTIEYTIQAHSPDTEHYGTVTEQTCACPSLLMPGARLGIYTDHLCKSLVLLHQGLNPRPVAAWVIPSHATFDSQYTSLYTQSMSI